MPYNFRRVPSPAEMNAFQAEVRSDESFVSARNLKNRAIIPDSGDNATAGMLQLPDTGDQRFFT